MPDSEIDLRGDSDILIAYLLLKIHLDATKDENITKDLTRLLGLYHQCLQAVISHSPPGETGE